MRRMVLAGTDVFDGERRRSDLALLVEDGIVAGILPAADARDAVDLGGGLIAPGFVDLQVNGGGGVLLNETPTVEGVRAICEAHALRGTTALLPTVITDRPAVTAAAIAAVREAIAVRVPGCLGIHVEGPFLSVARKGAHDPALIRPMAEADFAMLEGAGIPVLLTVAAETVSPAEIARLVALGVHVAIGHSDASFETASAAFAAGARGATHLFNAMSGLGHRAPGVVGAVLDAPEVWAGIIPDGFHVHPAAMAAAIRGKRGPGRVFAVSDAMSTVGSDADVFFLNGRRATRRDGRLTLEDGTLAGSDIELGAGVRYLVRALGLPVEEALRMGALYPAEFLGVSDRYGRLVPGTRADFVHLSDDLAVLGVWIGGERVS